MADVNDQSKTGAKTPAVRAQARTLGRGHQRAGLIPAAAQRRRAARPRARRNHRRTGLIVATTAAVQLAGCATYQHAVVDDLSPRDRVRLEVDDSELPALVAFAEGPRGRLAGRFVGMAGDSATFQLQNATGYRTVTLAPASVVFLERRKPELARSLLLSGAIVGGVGVLAYLGFEGGGQGGDPDTGGPEALTPLFFISFPFGR